MNVVLITAHGLNCHWLGPFGNEWVSTPALDKLACEAICFDQHFADDPTPAGYAHSLQPFALLLDQLRTKGVFTALLDDRRTAIADPRTWHHRTQPAYTAHDSFAEARVAAFEETIPQLPREQPWLLCLETDRMLPPWDADNETYLDYAQNVGGFTEGSETEENSPEMPPETLPEATVDTPLNEPTIGPMVKPNDADWHRLRHTFATTLSGFDAEVEMLWDILREQGFNDSTCIIFTSGYGFALGEHDWLGTATLRPHEEFAHLPFIIRLPKGHLGNRRVSGFTQATDLTKTLFDLFDIEASEVVGQSLLPLCQGNDSTRQHVFSKMQTEHGPSFSVRVPEWAYFKPPQGEPLLYRKPDDRWEISDVSRAQPGPCEELETLITATLENKKS